MTRKRKSTSIECDEDAVSPGDSIIQECSHIRTREQYCSTNNGLARSRWLQRNHPEHITCFEGVPTHKNIILPLSIVIVKDYLNMASTKHDRLGNPILPTQHNSFSHVNAAKSALIYLYKSHGPIEAKLVDMMRDFMQGYQRRVAELKEKGEMKITEGKEPISRDAYIFLAKEAILSHSDHLLNIMSHTFLIMCWNLIARATSCASLMLYYK
ncbi:hypothetical protein THRCLA_22859 [Thraustotheca clavata]|uniref:Uncharacterized protein n=1 Tax=Thraustotheca clavata TaxID=74557 RepID=A0A1V9YS16_9STRA|nr:hypothetical protein THRCLA_22859 [Thraustotheca clavata]